MASAGGNGLATGERARPTVPEDEHVYAHAQDYDDAEMKLGSDGLCDS